MASNYKELCREYLDNASARPAMYFRNLSELEAMMHGHGHAFLQLELIEGRADAFNTAFGVWIGERHGISAAAGWAVGVQEAAQSTGGDPIELFFELVQAFFDEWQQKYRE